MKVDIVTHRDGVEEVVSFDYAKREDGEKPMVLDVLLQYKKIMYLNGSMQSRKHIHGRRHR